MKEELLVCSGKQTETENKDSNLQTHAPLQIAATTVYVCVYAKLLVTSANFLA